MTGLWGAALVAALLLPPAGAAAAAAERQALRCPDGHAPILTGHPFRPLICAPGGKEPPRAAVAVSSAVVPPAGKGDDLRLLDGAWRGLAYFGGARYECELTVSDGGRRGTWVAMDYATHIGHAMEAALKKPGWFSRGVPKAEVVAPDLPGAKLSARVWLAPGVAAWRFDGRPEAHRVEYAVSGDRLTVRYTDFDPGRGPIGATLDLTRIR